MLIIEYDPESTVCVPDSKVLDMAKKYNNCAKNYPETHLIFGQGLVIDAFRVLVTLKEIDYKEIRFKFKDQIMMVDRNGRLNIWPRGFCDITDSFLDILLDCEMEKEITK